VLHFVAVVPMFIFRRRNYYRPRNSNIHSYVYCISVVVNAFNVSIVVVVIAPKWDHRRFIIAAHDLNMTRGDYVFYKRHQNSRPVGYTRSFSL